MGALRMGLDDAELKPLVDAWRDANPMVVQFWQDIEQASGHHHDRNPNTRSSQTYPIVLPP